MLKKFLLTAFCKDRPGIVADISQIIYENGCNLEDSTMTSLAGEFAIILLFSPLSVGEEADLEERLSKDCRRLEREKGITAFIRPFCHEDRKPKADYYNKNLHVEGLDQAGIVFKVSRFLADNDINIRTVNSKVRSSPESGVAVYSIELPVEIPEYIPIEDVEEGLYKIGDQLNIDITIE